MLSFLFHHLFFNVVVSALETLRLVIESMVILSKEARGIRKRGLLSLPGPGSNSPKRLVCPLCVGPRKLSWLLSCVGKSHIINCDMV